MVMLSCSKDQFKELIRKRRLMGGDRLDEVWDGVYVMSPLADNEHQRLAGKLSRSLSDASDHVVDTEVFTGCNVSDQAVSWRKNYRCPDVAVFLAGNPARDMGAYWLGGPDFAVEILSPGDRARKKYDFYAKVGVRELLLVDRRRWRLELYRLDNGALTLVGRTEITSTEVLTSQVLPASFRMIAGPERPLLEITQLEDARHWTV